MNTELEERIRRETNTPPEKELGGATLGIRNIMQARKNRIGCQRCEQGGYRQENAGGTRYTGSSCIGTSASPELRISFI